MEFCYRKLMGNGAVTSKFRLQQTSPEVEGRELPDPAPIEDVQEKTTQSADHTVEFSDTHHNSNCIRCYRLKKKCSRLYPKCHNCTRAGSSCDYVDRQNKRKKKEKKEYIDPKYNEDEHVVAHKLVLIRLLLTDGGRLPSPRPVVKPEPVVDVLVTKVLALPVDSNLKEEFVTIRSIEQDDLPSAWVSSFFHNYEYAYPFVNKPRFLEAFGKIDFRTEAIVNMDMYLLLAIGCLVHDANNHRAHFDQYFSTKTIESFINVLHFGSDTHESAHLLVLLCLFALTSFNEHLSWAADGLLVRAVVDLDLHRSTNPDHHNLLWSIYNIDKELSLLLGRPSQFPADIFIRVPFPSIDPTTQTPTGTKLQNHHIQLRRLYDSLLTYRLSSPPSGETLKTLSLSLEKWRVAISSLIHSEFAGMPALQECIGAVNVDYYYLLIELDQVSLTESFQFTLQFLSNSFGLILSDADTKQDKHIIKPQVYSLLWYRKFFNVIHYNLNSLVDIITTAGPTASLKISEFHGNLQLMVNLLRHIGLDPTKPAAITSRIAASINALSSLNVKLMNYTPEAKDVILDEIRLFQTI